MKGGDVARSDPFFFSFFTCHLLSSLLRSDNEEEVGIALYPRGFIFFVVEVDTSQHFGFLIGIGFTTLQGRQTLSIV